MQSIGGKKVVTPHLCENFVTFTQSDYFVADNVDYCGLYGVQTKNNQERYIYKDYGAGYFTDFKHAVDFHWVAIGYNGDYSRFIFWMLGNDIGGWNELKTASKTAIAVMFDCPGGEYRIGILETYGGAEYSSFCGNLPYLDARYYVTIEKTGNIVTLKIYSDAERTNLVATTSLTLHGDWNFRYLFASSSYISGTLTTGTCDIENLDLDYIGIQCKCKGYVYFIVTLDGEPGSYGTIEVNGVGYEDRHGFGKGDYTLTWRRALAYPTTKFSKWVTSGNISVANPNAETTTLTVMGDGTLTLELVS
jgi:hypothetical protein